MLTDYTTYDEVRAALGVSVEEIPDVTLALAMYELGLVADLEDISATLQADFATIFGENEPRAASHQAVYDAVRLFSPYSIAVQLATSLPLFTPKQITEGKAAFTRDSSSPYKTAIENAKKSFDRYRARLTTKYAIYKSTSTVATKRPYGGGVAPTSDPVTGT